jgi:hypothetical protein
MTLDITAAELDATVSRMRQHSMQLYYISKIDTSLALVKLMASQLERLLHPTETRR